MTTRTESILDVGSPMPWNTTYALEDITLDSNFAWLLCALVSSMVLVIYVTYYNSRVIGFILTKIINKFFVKNGYLKLGSFSVSVLSGKIMYRDVVYITSDYSIRIQDGWLIFRWWRNYVQRDITSEDLSHADTRVSILLNGLEVHFYNRSSTYSHMEKLFGLEQLIYPPGTEPTEDKMDEQTSVVAKATESNGIQWRDLIPVIKIDISCGRFVFGNRLLPTTLLISVEEAHLVYTTKQASSRLDQFMHVTKCKAENFKVILAPSLKYTGMVDEPPRFMGEGFVVLQSNRVDVYYYMDEPGVVPEEPEMVQLANGDIIPQRTSPAWGVEIKCGKGTDFSYGPWADRQREELFKFFFPQDYQPLQVTCIAKPGELRQYASFDIRLSSLADATIDILFSKNKETNAIHMNVGPGSYLEVTIPWITTEIGYTTRINGQLLHLDASTSLQYRSLIESETLEFDIKVAYPINWNAHQDWTCNLTGCKATVTFIYEHKNFFQDLMADWSSKAQPDLLRFVPFTWHFNIVLKEFELITLANEYNWVDCSSQNPENAHLAFCGEVLDLSFDLPLIEFLPKTVPMKFWIQGESVDLVLFLPEVNTSRNILISLSQNAKITNRDGTLHETTDKEKKWRNIATKSNHWIDCWTVPIVALSIGYIYHPVPPLGPRSHALDYTTPEKEEILLLPMRPPIGEEVKTPKTRKKFCEGFNPMTLMADKINLELEIGPSVLYMYGSILTSLMNVKENYFGENQKFIDLDISSKAPVTSKHNETFDDNEVPDEEFDARLYRPLEITVSVTMHDIQGHLMTNCSGQDPPCPSLYLERFGFEMHKLYQETRLQLLLSPLILSATDAVPRSEGQSHLKDGHIAFSGLQVRGHAMFSDEGRSLDDETLEYAWLVEVQIGDITGRLTTPQVQQVVNGLEAFLFLVEDMENALQHPIPHKLCQHQISQAQCAETIGDYFCPTVEDIKYRMTRLSVDAVELYLVEAGTALCLQLYPIRFSTCNLHGYQTRAGITALIQDLHLKQFILANPHTNMFAGNTTHNQSPGDIWLEVGGVNLGPLFIDAAQAQTHPDMHIVQNKFLKLHDTKTKRLWFLWPPEMKLVQSKLVGRCGCVGGCCFFGSNRNGASLFQPKPSDESEGINVAVFRIFKDSSDLGYGQSLLHENQLIFDLPGMDHDLGDSPTQAKRFGMLCRTHRSQTRSIVNDSGSQPFFVKGAGDSCETLLTDQETTTSTENLKEFASRQNSYDTTTGSLMSMPIPRQPAPSDALAIGGGSLDSHEASSIASPSPSLPADSMSAPAELLMPASSSVGSFLEDHQHNRQDSITSESKLSMELNSLQTSVPSLAGVTVPMNIRRDSRSSLNGLPPPLISKSSSRQSLSNGSMRPLGPAHSPRTVRRALSTGSDSAQSSDIFFSAEELGHLTPEERMLLPHYASGEYHHSLRRAPHGSKRSLQDIQEQSLQDSNPTLVQAPAETEGDVEPQDNHSVSSTSFISALSSQEDLAMVDLHMQLNRPITESPLLMSCYTCHMTKLQCTHWYQPPPLPHVVPQSGGAVHSQPWQNLPFAYFRTRWVPQFHNLSEGFTSIRMVEKGKGAKHQPPPPPILKSPTHPHPWDFKPLGSGKNKKDEETTEEEILCTCDSSITKTTVVVKLKGAIEVFISPLLLEATQRFVEALTPTLGSIHALNIVNHLHARCSSKVQSMNLLKKEKYMYVTQVRESRKTAADPKRPSGQISPTSSTYEETQLSQLQVFIKINKINICILQSSIVEEVISFSALDNVRDLTCVSLLALCCDNLSAKIHCSSQSKKVIQTFTDDSPDSSLHRKSKNVRAKKAKTDWFPSEPVTIETNEVQQEENVATVNVGKVHVQLRRLENSSSILKEAVLTVISKQRSKVLFSFERVPLSTSLSSSVADKDRMDAFGMHEPCLDFDDDKMGFIMFECGVEDYCLTMVKRMGFNGLTVDLNRTDSEETLASASTHTIPNRTKSSTNVPKQSPSNKRDTNTNSGTDVGANKQASTPSDQSEPESEYTGLKETAKPDMKGDVSSCVIELKTVWFNFAAPPYTPNTRKIDFTRLDWHLLSTASPAINSWMNPSDRLLISIKKLRQESAHRQSSVMACLMTEALDIQGIHMPIKGKYHKLTPLAKTLREDPSCQLLTVLKRYVNSTDLNLIEENLQGEFVPQLSTLRKGLVSVSRQWKNVLYMPMLIEQKYKMRKNIRPLVSFALPLVESIQNLEDELEISIDDCEVTDEKTLLLKAEGGALSGPFLSKVAFAGVSSSPQGSGGESSSGSESLQDLTEGGFSISTLSAKPRKRLPSYVPRSSRASIAFPVAAVSTLESPLKSSLGMGATYFGSSNLPSGPSKLASQNQLQVKMKRHESNYSLHSGTCSVSSIDPNPPSSSLGTPQRCPPENKREDEDLYNWMVRQQDYMRVTSESQKLSMSVGLESNMNTLTTEHSGDEDVLQSFPSPTLNLAPLTTQLADAHVIFQPLLSLLGVPSQITGTTIGQKFGPNVSVSGSLTLLRVDIVESDTHRKLKRKHQKLSQERLGMQGKFFIDTSAESPAFLCDRLAIDVDLREVKDLERARIEETSLNADKHHLQPTFVFASGDSFKKPTTTVVNFGLNISYISQQINMPLLRLLHQFFSMYQNVRETQMELKENRLSFHKENFMTHKKQDSSSGSESQPEATKVPSAPTVTDTSTLSPTPKEATFPDSVSTQKSQNGISVRRPQSLTQRLRVSSKGYTNLNERAGSPLSLNLSESVAMDVVDYSVASDKTIVDQIKENMPKCWRTMYYLLDLYATMPETKTVTNRSPVAPADVSDDYKGNGKYEPLKEHKIDIDEPDVPVKSGSDKKKQGSSSLGRLRSLKRSLVVHDRVPTVVFGVVKIRRTRLLATLSGLKLEAELTTLHSSITYKEKIRSSSKKWTESSVTGHLGRSMIVLLEGIAPNLQTVVKVTVGKSQALYSSHSRRAKDKNSALITIGPIIIDIPQHPVVLHGMMTRGSKQLSTTLQELRASRVPPRISRTSEDLDTAATRSPKPTRESCPVQVEQPRQQQLLKPIAVHFSIILDSLTIGAALLPSLQAQYRMDQVASSGVTGSKAKFTVNLPKHTLSFATKVQASEANLPSSASVELPPVHLSAEYIQQGHNSKESWDAQFAEKIVLRQGGYLSAVAEIGAFEHSLSTDLLNHLVFVQKVFMKEVNEVVQKMSGSDKPVPLWAEDEKSQPVYQLLYTLQLRLKGIQITATTPTNSALRLETGILELQLSNRVQNMSSKKKRSNSSAKLFGKAHVDLNVSLGQLLKNALFEEAEPEFQQFAYFKTVIALRNALQDEMISSQSGGKEAVLITLNRPLVYIQPIALDKAVIVWLNYKNAYEYWNEQRATLNKEVLTATQQVIEKVTPISQLSSQTLGTLFLQLTIDDMGMCLPMNPDTSGLGLSRHMYDADPRAACVVTLENTRISACSSGSLVSKGSFHGLCIRFADDFETSLDDWKPDPADTNIMNLCIVSEGTYEVCSRTVINQGTENAKWILNVQWQMEGVDIHVDNNIGKQLSLLANTLTSLAGYEEDKEGTELDYDLGLSDQVDGQRNSSQDVVVTRKPNALSDNYAGLVFDSNMDAKKRSRLIEKEMNEQAKIVNDLKTLGASQSTIEQEIRRLQELEAAVFIDFRRDVIKKLRRQSVRQASSIKDKLGLGSKSTSQLRSKSVVIPHSPSADHPLSNLPSPPGVSLTPSSVESSPTHGHTRTVSFDGANLTRVTFDDASSMLRRNFALSSSDGLDTDVEAGYVPLTSSSRSPLSPTVGFNRKVVPANSTPEPMYSTSESSANTNLGHLDSNLDPDAFSSVLRRPADHSTVSPGHATSTGPERPGLAPSAFKQTAPEPNIDFELDVKVFINSGKCVLHTKEFSRDDDKNKSFRKERSFSNSTFEFPTSPGNRKRSANVRPTTSTTKLKPLPVVVPTVDFTVFLIPGLDVKVHYNSKTLSGESPVSAVRTVSMMDLASQDSRGIEGAVGFQKKPGIKKATLFAWLTLQGIPEECVITPQILDFLEQALEPIPMAIPPLKSSQIPSDAMESVFELNQNSFGTPATYVYASFPVDVTVFFRMQPSTLRFSCLPVSRVECLLRLPSLDLVISSKRAEDELYMSEFGDNNPLLRQPKAGMFSGMNHLNKDNSGSSDHPIQPPLADLSQTAVGGLSVTGCLADFSLYIFHPYGGKKAGLAVGSSREASSESSPLSDSERKDSLSLQVEFVKVNISRSRKINVNMESSSQSQPKTGSRSIDTKGAVIRFSAICDIGSASFKYDMRRLTEILAFPKAWYRRSIVRRLFLGDQSTGAFYSDQEDSLENSSTPSSPLTPDSMTSKNEVFNFPAMPRSIHSSTQLSSSITTSSPRSVPAASVSSSGIPQSRRSTNNRREARERLHLNLEGGLKPKRRSATSAPGTPQSSLMNGHQESSISPDPFQDHSHASKGSSSWETLVLFAVNLSKLNIHMNMGNVMGITMWTTRDTIAQGRLSIGSSGHKNMFLSLGLGGSSLDAKGGIVGGTIELSHIDTYVHIKEDPGMEPDHKFGMKLFALEARLDYMGSSMLMARVSSLTVTLRDEWRVNVDHSMDPSSLPTKRPALIFIHGDLGWDQLQLIISKSTTADLVKMVNKLEEFFTQQFKSSKRVFSSLQPRMPRHVSKRHQNLAKVPKKKANDSGKQREMEARHHRHWQKVLSKVSGLQLTTLPLPLPKHGTILGGTMELHGNHISLACFHDINFRAKHWALFSLREPSISFATEAQSVVNPNAVDTHVVQNLSFSLGHNVADHPQHTSMATVCRISRNFLFPPQFRTMKEWFHYAFYISELDEVDRFPSLERDRSDSVTTERQHQRTSSKGQDFTHTMECIFSLPSLQFILKTEHMQAETTPEVVDDKPVVECSFVTEFEDHIFVTVDAEAFFFLHDLITAYIKEKERTIDRATAHTPEGDSERKRKVAHPTELLQKDWRNYECKTWHLEPTVRLLSWAGKGIEPYGVDYILQKLGFAHARVTIPKWMQRGTMDPLDKILSVLMGKMVDAVREERDAPQPPDSAPDFR